MKQLIVNQHGIFADIEHLDNDGNIIYTSHTVNLLHHEHTALKAEIIKVKEKLEQVAFGIKRDDHDQNKARFAQIIDRLRELENHPQFGEQAEQEIVECNPYVPITPTTHTTESSQSPITTITLDSNGNYIEKNSN